MDDSPPDTDADRTSVARAAKRPKVTFADVAGVDETLAELREFKDYLVDPERFQAVGAELPRGVLLYGPPGTGKTLLARALAGEADVDFSYVSAASFVEQYVGIGAARIRKLFDEARSKAPSIVFVDELDAVGRRRSDGSSGDREFDNTLNQLLVELDGISGDAWVLIVGATNRPELLDSALTRPGRFDRRIPVDLPDLVGREAILRLHAEPRPFSRKVDWKEVAAQTSGLSGAELAHIVNESALLAARRNHRRVSPEDVEEAITRVMRGPRSARLMSAEHKRLTAYHESGHALLSAVLRGVSPPPRVSVVARTGVVGRSPWAPPESGDLHTRRDLMAQLTVLLGGRAAEMNVFGEPTTGAEDDLEDAARLAQRMVERWAMTGRFELAGRHDDTLRLPIDGQGVRALVAWAEKAARGILEQHAAALHRLAEALVERETLSGPEIAELAEITPDAHAIDPPAAKPQTPVGLEEIA